MKLVPNIAYRVIDTREEGSPAYLHDNLIFVNFDGKFYNFKKAGPFRQPYRIKKSDIKFFRFEPYNLNPINL